MIEAIIAGLTAGIAVTIGNAILYILSKKTMRERDRKHLQLSLMIATNQVRAQTGKTPAYSECQFQTFLNEEE